MPRQSNGTYIAPGGTAAVSGSPISSTAFNTLETDIGSEITNSLDRLGRSPMQAALPMGANKVTGMANGSATDDAAAYGQLTNAMPPGAYFGWAGAALPAGYLWCNGAAVSRATYANLFGAIGTVWGAGDGSTTFNLPDFRGRVPAGADNMGGTAAGRLTGYSLGVVGGAQTHVLTQAEMPAHSHADAGHTHGVNDPSHTHAYAALGGGGGTVAAGSNFNTPTAATAASTTGITIQTGVANIQNTGGGGAHTIVQPTAAGNYIIRY